MRFALQKTLSYVSLVFLLFVASGNANTQDTNPLAYILRLTGVVRVTDATHNSIRKASPFYGLYKGDRVETSENASATILLSGIGLIPLESNSAITIDTTPPIREQHMLSGFDSEITERVDELIFYSSEDGRIAPLPGIRNDDPAELAENITLLSPRSTIIKSRRPTFSWFVEKSFEQFEVQLDDQNGDLVWRGETSENHLVYPEEAPLLEPDIDYYWKVSGDLTFQSITSRPESFQVISEIVLQEVLSNEARIRRLFGNDPDSSTYWLMLGTYYDKEALRAHAIDCFTHITEMYPDAVLPREVLSKIYLSIGLKKSEVDALERARDQERRD